MPDENVIRTELPALYRAGDKYLIATAHSGKNSTWMSIYDRSTGAYEAACIYDTDTGSPWSEILPSIDYWINPSAADAIGRKLLVAQYSVQGVPLPPELATGAEQPDDWDEADPFPGIVYRQTTHHEDRGCTLEASDGQNSISISHRHLSAAEPVCQSLILLGQHLGFTRETILSIISDIAEQEEQR